MLRPALEEAGLPPGAVGLVRSPDREGARALVSLPRLVPLVILRGSGETTAALARLAAEHGVRTLAHAEGGGVLYVHAAADPAKASALVEASLDRLGVCNRLNLLLVDARGAGVAAADRRAARAARDRGARRPSAGAAALAPLDVRSGTSGRTTRSASRRSRSTSSTALDEAVRLANDETSGARRRHRHRGRGGGASASSTATAARRRSGRRRRASPTASR